MMETEKELTIEEEFEKHMKEIGTSACYGCCGCKFGYYGVCPYCEY